MDAVVYASCNYGVAPATAQEEAVRSTVLEPFGLGAARLFGVWLGESGNLASAMRLARSLLVGANLRTVLVVVADAIPAQPGEYRAMPNAVTINGDAAACLLSTRLPGPYQLVGIGQAAVPAMAAAGRRRGLREYLHFMSGVRSALTLLYQTSGTTAESYQWMVANNYSAANLDDFADIARIPHDRLFRGNVPRYGHLFAADGLINLAGLAESTEIVPGERVLLLSTGPFSWGAVGLLRLQEIRT